MGKIKTGSAFKLHILVSELFT